MCILVVAKTYLYHMYMQGVGGELPAEFDTEH